MKHIPAIVYGSLLITIFAFIALDYEKAIDIYLGFVEWVADYPYIAIIVVVIMYSVEVVLNMPVVINHFIFTYTYCKVFKSQVKAFFFVIPVIMIGMQTGALAAFLIARYVCKDFVTRQLKRNKKIFTYFSAMDGLFESEGAKMMAMVRLTINPFPLTSYIMGVTTITTKDFLIGNLSYTFRVMEKAIIASSLYALKPEGNILEAFTFEG